MHWADPPNPNVDIVSFGLRIVFHDAAQPIRWTTPRLFLAPGLKCSLEGLIGKRSGSRYEAGKRTGAWIKIKLHQEKNSLSADITNPKGLESILERCLLASTKARNSNLVAELEPALAKSSCALSFPG